MPNPVLDERAPEGPVIGRRRVVADTHATGRMRSGRMRSGRARPGMDGRADASPRDGRCGPPNGTVAQRCGGRGAAGATVGVHTPATADAGRARPPVPPAGHAA